MSYTKSLKNPTPGHPFGWRGLTFEYVKPKQCGTPMRTYRFVWRSAQGYELVWFEDDDKYLARYGKLYGDPAVSGIKALDSARKELEEMIAFCTNVLQETE